MRALLAEATGTFALVFAGTGAIVCDAASGGGVGHVGISLTFGLVVLAMIQSMGDVSGAHLNPAVSLGFAAAGRFPWRRVAPYAAAQTAGAILASALLHLLFPSDGSLGRTEPTGAAWRAFVLETLLTWLLMLVILSVSDGSRERGILAGVAVGGVVAMEALFAGPITGASMNPARSLAPALVSGRLSDLWIYLAAPPLGAWIAVATCACVRNPGCCPSAAGCGR